MHLLDEDMRSGMHLLELKLDEEMRSWSVIEKERKDTEYVAVEPINNKEPQRNGGERGADEAH